MGILLLKSQEKVDIKFIEGDLIDKYKAQESISSLLIDFNVCQESYCSLNHSWCNDKWITAIFLETHTNRLVKDSSSSLSRWPIIILRKS